MSLTGAPWCEAALRRFVADARVSFALLLHPNGVALAQHGFTTTVDVSAAAALAAGIRASAAQLGRELEGKPFQELCHLGLRRQIYLADVVTAGGTYVLLTVLERGSSMGLVRLFFKECAAALAIAAPPVAPGDGAAVLAPDFERDLHAGLEALFGRARADGSSSFPTSSS